MAHHDLLMVVYKALTGLSLLRVPHFCARHGASLKDLNLDTTSMSKAKCLGVTNETQGSTPTLVKHSSYEELE
jgi:hypothetical protein